jgi:hypothetical protein
MKKKEQPIFVLCRTNEILMSVGLGLIITFFIIFIILAVLLKRVDVYSFLFHNILNHLFLTVLGGFHVGLLGFGILIEIIAFFNMTPEIRCYSDRFDLSLFLQKKKVIPFNEISKVAAKVYYLNYEDLIKGYPKKECRVFFYNKIHDFYISYPVNGYFDDIELFLKDDKEDLSKRCVCRKELAVNLLSRIKKYNALNMPFLPEEMPAKKQN